MTLNNKPKLISIVLSICFILIAFLGSVHFCCFDESFYQKEHDSILIYGKHINEHIGISNDELKELTHFVLEYLNNPNASLDKKMIINEVNREVFTDDEKTHMVDVRRLNLISVYILEACTVIFVFLGFIYFYNKHSITLFKNIYLKTLIITFVIFAILSIFILTDFDTFWTYFHKIFFAGNNLWILDLRKDILIMIVPPEFFNHLVIRIVCIFVLAIILMYLLLNLIRKKVYD